MTMAETLETILPKFWLQQQRANGYAARLEIERILAPLRGDPKRLEPHGFKVYSQNDEDGIIEEIFRRLEVTQGRFLEIGVESGLECNSLYLIHKGWRGVWIEGDRGQQASIEGKFSSILRSRLRVAFTMVRPDNIARVITSVNGDAELDFLSIDIDGNDIYIMENIEIRPKVLCIEYNGKFPGNISKRPSYDPDRRWARTDYMGCSLKEITLSAKELGYRLVGTNITGVNAFFVRDDLARDLFPDEASSEALYNPARYYLWADHFSCVGHQADFGPYVDLTP